MVAAPSSAAPTQWYFDIISPYAYLAYYRLGEIERHRTVELKPAVFAGFLKHWGQLGPAEIAPKRLHIYRQCDFLARRNGLPFRLPPRHPFPPLNILRLLVALDAAPAAVERAFRAVWGEGRDPNDPAVLADVAAAGGDPLAVGRIGDDDVKQRLAANGAEGIAAGGFGVPTLVIDGEVFWGYDAVDMALAYCEDPAIFQRGDIARAGAVPVGAVRKR
jgi:2-hydroxychromene-2-carboxylate isomerase